MIPINDIFWTESIALKKPDSIDRRGGDGCGRERSFVVVVVVVVVDMDGIVVLS
jgi:hypothetical protein